MMLRNSLQVAIPYKVMAPFASAHFTMLLDIADGVDTYWMNWEILSQAPEASHRSIFSVNYSLDFLSNWHFIERRIRNFPRDKDDSSRLAISETGRKYINYFEFDEIENMLLPSVTSWHSTMHWAALLKALDRKLHLNRHRWVKLGLMDKSGFTNNRGCQLLQRLCKEEPHQLIQYVLNTFKIDNDTNSFCFKYLARHIPYGEWALMLQKLDCEASPGSEEILLSLVREVKKIT